MNKLTISLGVFLLLVGTALGASTIGSDISTTGALTASGLSTLGQVAASSLAVGASSTATGHNSIALGGASVSADNTLDFGSLNVLFGSSTGALRVLGGQISVDASNVMVKHANGFSATYTATSNTDAARGDALKSAVAAAVSGDAIIVGPGTYAVTSSLTLPANASLVGIGRPSLVGTGLTNPLLIVAANNITIENFNLTSNSAGIGAYVGGSPVTATGLVLRNLHISISDSQGNGIAWAQNELGGNSQNNIQADIYDSVISSAVGSGNGGFGIFAGLNAAGHLRIYNCDVYGDTDGVLLAGNSSAVVEIYGGYYRSVLDAITSGGPTVYVNNAKARGEQSDLFADGGRVVPVWVDVSSADYVTGNQGNTATHVISGNLNAIGQISVGNDTTATAGAIRFDGTHFYGYNGSTWKQLDN